MKGISVTVGILILTVFLSLSPPAYAGTATSHTLFDYAEYPNGTPADGELVTIYKYEDPLNNTTAEVGSSFGVPGWWKADLYNIPVSVINGDTIIANVLGESKTYIVNTSKGGGFVSASVVTPTPPATSDGGDDNGGSSSGGGGGDGTYPPGWGETPTPTATSAPAAAEPTVASTGAPTEAPTKAPTKTPTVAATEIATTKMKSEGIPGFGAVLTVFAIAGLLVATYLVMRRRE